MPPWTSACQVVLVCTSVVVVGCPSIMMMDDGEINSRAHRKKKYGICLWIGIIMTTTISLEDNHVCRTWRYIRDPYRRCLSRRKSRRLILLPSACLRQCTVALMCFFQPLHAFHDTSLYAAHVLSISLPDVLSDYIIQWSRVLPRMPRFDGRCILLTVLSDLFTT